MKKKIWKILPVLFAGLLAGGESFLFAYSDEISAPLEEVWQGVQETLKPYGIKNMNRDQGEIQSRWIQDRVKRSRGLLRKIASQIYARRYRLKVRLKPAAYLTTIEIRGTFEERPLDSPPAAQWRNYELQPVDYDVERDFFMQLLKTLEGRRQNATPL